MIGVDAVSEAQEDEVLMRHGQTFEIFEIEKKGSKHIVRLLSI